MVVLGNFRNRAELRKAARRHFNYNANVLLEKDQPLVPCLIHDISEAGARLRFGREIELPEKFILLLSANGHARRQCKLIWREGVIAGVEFPLHQEHEQPQSPPLQPSHPVPEPE